MPFAKQTHVLWLNRTLLKFSGCTNSGSGPSPWIIGLYNLTWPSITVAIVAIVVTITPSILCFVFQTGGMTSDTVLEVGDPLINVFACYPAWVVFVTSIAGICTQRLRMAGAAATRRAAAVGQRKGVGTVVQRR